MTVLYGKSNVSMSIDSNPLEYASRLCKLVNKSAMINSAEYGGRDEVQTLDNLSGMIRKIYLKIRE